MRKSPWLITVMMGLLLTGCAGVSTAPTPEARQALAPTGKLRVALQQGNPLNVLTDAKSGATTGVGYDLGNELARRLGVPFEPVMYPSVGALLDSGKTGAWDVAFVGYSAERAKEWDFSALHQEVEFGYLVPGGSSISSMADIERSGIRIAVQAKSGPDNFFSRTSKKCCGDPRSKQPWRIGRGESRPSRCNGQHQASPVRAVESIARFSSTRRAARHRSTCHGDAERTRSRRGLWASVH